MTARRLDLVFLGLSLSSSWGNGHATTYRALLRGLAARGHEVLFLERDVPWYAAAPRPGAAGLLPARALPRRRGPRGPLRRDASRQPTRSIVGSYVPDGIAVDRLACSHRARQPAPSTTSTRRSRGGARRTSTAPISRRARSRRSTSICLLPAARCCSASSSASAPAARSALLLGRRRALPEAGNAGALGPRLSRHLCRGPSAGAAAAADRAGTPAARAPLRGRRFAVSGRRSTGRPMSSASSTCRRRTTPPSTAGSASP